jgi:hypothetical protein
MVDIHFPCGTVCESHSLFDGPRIFGSEEGFTVLCFLGFGGEETVKAVGAIKGLLEGLGAKCYGVSMTPPERRCGLTICKCWRKVRRGRVLMLSQCMIAREPWP